MKSLPLLLVPVSSWINVRFLPPPGIILQDLNIVGIFRLSGRLSEVNDLRKYVESLFIICFFG